MPSLRFLSSSSPPARAPSPIPVYSTADDDDDYSSDQDDSTRLSRRSSSSYFLLPRAHATSGSALASGVASPYPSRPGSPLPPLYTSASSEDEPSSPLILSTSFGSSGRRKRWWPRRRKHDLRGLRRTGSRILRHPLFPTQPITILLSLLLFTTFGLLLTLSLIWFLNPDKYALPWRDYCAATPSFPPPDFESIPPAGVFLGVFSMDAAVERRMLVRTTWASHVRSRGLDDGTDRTVVRFILGKPKREWERRIQLEMQMYNDIVILPISENMNNGKTHAYFTWAHENALVPPSSTNHTHNPVHRLPSAPKVPSPKAPLPIPPAPPSNEPTLPPPPTDNATVLDAVTPEPRLPSKRSGLAPAIRASHDPRPKARAPKKSSHHTKRHGPRRERETWVRPDFVVKADDDSFVMLAELEARLRVEWDLAMKDAMAKPGIVPLDPLIFWGYLVKSRFMAGELYALSSALVEYVATSAPLKSMTRGAEDKQTAKWMRLHPEADQVRWRSEHCWIYDHPRAGTVYSHGILFPSEAERVTREVQLAKAARANATSSSSSSSMGLDWAFASSTATGPTSSGGTAGQPQWTPGAPDPYAPMPPASPFLSHSSVSRFGTRYSLPVNNLTLEMQVEALVEGSATSELRPTPETDSAAVGGLPTWKEVERAWEDRETYEERYAPSSASDGFFGKRGIGLGGTVVVHFIKRNEWFLEAALALLGPSINGDEGRIDNGGRNAAPADDLPSTVVAKTQAFRRGVDDEDEDEDGSLVMVRNVETDSESETKTE